MTDETKDDFAALFDEDFMQMMAGRECVCVCCRQHSAAFVAI